MQDESSALLPHKHHPSVWEEIYTLLKLWVPLFFGTCAWVCMKTTDTALLGHVGTHYLSAAAVSDLWTSATGVFIEGRILTSFCAQALGANNPKLAGVWLQVSVLVLGVFAIPVLLLSMLTPWVLRGFGVADALAWDATKYAWILATCIPVRVIFIQLEQYFQAQSTLYPGVIVSTTVMACNLVLGLVLVLGVGIPAWLWISCMSLYYSRYGVFAVGLIFRSLLFCSATT